MEYFSADMPFWKGNLHMHTTESDGSATLAEDLDTSETTVDVSNAAVFAAGQVIEIDSERMEISAATVNADPTPDTLTVTRAVNGTTAAAHTSGAAIRVAVFPGITEAAIQQVS